MCYKLAHYAVTKIIQLTFDFTQETNSDLPGESPEFVWPIGIPSQPLYADFITLNTLAFSQTVNKCSHPVRLISLQKGAYVYWHLTQRATDQTSLFDNLEVRLGWFTMPLFCDIWSCEVYIVKTSKIMISFSFLHRNEWNSYCICF